MAKNQYLPPKVRRPREELAQAVEQIESAMGLIVAGSWRRQKETVGDLDVVVPHTLDFGVVGEEFASLLGYKEMRGGALKSEGILEYKGQPLLLNLWRVQGPRSYGGMLLYTTGPHDLNIMMRGTAKGRGWLLNDKGLFGDEGNQMDIGGQEGATYESLEADIFHLLGLQYLTPVERETWRDHLLRKRDEEKKYVEVWSSDGYSKYTVTIENGKASHCECKGFTYRQRCRHLAEAEAELRK